jgi:AcrR family transcriptional regulator
MSPTARRAQLVETALHLFATTPPERVSVDDVARAADVSRALLYRYFAGIEELRVAALGSVVRELVERVELRGGQLRPAVADFLTIAHRHRAAYVALLRGGSAVATGETATLLDGVRAHIVGLLGGPTADPLQLVTLRSWVAVVETATLAWLQDGGVARAELEEWLVAQFGAMTAVTAARTVAQ